MIITKITTLIVNKGKLVSFVKRAEERPATHQRSRVLVAQLGALARHRRCSSFWVKGHQDALLSLLGRNAPPVAPGSRPKRWPTAGQICNSAIKTAARIGPRKMPMMPNLSSTRSQGGPLAWVSKPPL